MYPGFWLWEARSVGFYEGLRVWEAPSVVLYEGLRVWEAYSLIACSLRNDRRVLREVKRVSQCHARGVRQMAGMGPGCACGAILIVQHWKCEKHIVFEHIS